MNIFIITTDEPFYLPIFFEKALEALKNEVIGMAVLSETKSKLKKLKKYLAFYGPTLFCVQLFWYIIYKISDKLSRVFPVKKLHSVKRIAEKNNIRIYGVKNINGKEFINRLKELKIDLVISVASPQIFKKELINTPPLGCINVHGAPLPKYRGMLPSFWMLYNGEKEGAVTIHYIDEGIDSGDIILQEEYDIPADISHHELIMKSKNIAADLLIRTVKLIREGKLKCSVNDAAGATYYSFPKKEEIRQFCEAGGRLR